MGLKLEVEENAVLCCESQLLDASVFSVSHVLSNPARGKESACSARFYDQKLERPKACTGSIETKGVRGLNVEFSLSSTMRSVLKSVSPLFIATRRRYHTHMMGPTCQRTIAVHTATFHHVDSSQPGDPSGALVKSEQVSAIDRWSELLSCYPQGLCCSRALDNAADSDTCPDKIVSVIVNYGQRLVSKPDGTRTLPQPTTAVNVWCIYPGDSPLPPKMSSALASMIVTRHSL